MSLLLFILILISGGVFPVDATIFEGGKAVAFVEVDGPHHYIDGQLRRKDRLKESLYRRYVNAININNIITNTKYY